MGFYATTDVRDEKRCSPVFRTHKSENRLIKTESLSSVPDAFKVCVENVYDYAGRRVRKTVSDDYSGGSYATTNVTTYVWDRFNIVAEMCDAGYTNYYTHGLDLSGTLQGAGGVGGLLAVTRTTSSDTNTYFACMDGNGNVCQYVDENGTVVAQREYGPFGGTISLTGDQKDIFTHWFSTKPLDAETGIVKFQKRGYLPDLGRFISNDPIEEEGGLNRYMFVLNDPVALFDLLGQVIYSDCPLDEYFKKYLSSWKGGPTEEGYSDGVSNGRSALRAHILIRMMQSESAFQPTHENEIKGLSDHVEMRLKIALIARNFDCSLASGCADAARKVFLLAGIRKDSIAVRSIMEPKDEGWIIGDWGYILNRNAYNLIEQDDGTKKYQRDKKKWPSGFTAGEHIIYIGAGKKYWGWASRTGSAERTYEEWFKAMRGWKSVAGEEAVFGDPMLASPQETSITPQVFYPNTGLLK